MKKAAIGMTMVIITFGTLFMLSPSMAADCRHDPIVRGQTVERDRAEQRLLSRWAKGAPNSELASQVGIIVSCELFIASMCRNEVFLKQNLHFLGTGNEDLRVETLPCLILERVLGKDILLPDKNRSNTEALK